MPTQGEWRVNSPSRQRAATLPAPLDQRAENQRKCGPEDGLRTEGRKPELPKQVSREGRWDFVDSRQYVSRKPHQTDVDRGSGERCIPSSELSKAAAVPR